MPRRRPDTISANSQRRHPSRKGRFKGQETLRESDLSGIPDRLKGFFRGVLTSQSSPVDFSLAKDSEIKGPLLDAFKRLGLSYLARKDFQMGLKCFSFCASAIGEGVLTKLGDRILEKHPYDAISAYVLAGNKKRIEEVGDEYLKKDVYDIAISCYKLLRANDKLQEVAETFLMNGVYERANEIFALIGGAPDNLLPLAIHLLEEGRQSIAFKTVKQYGTELDMSLLGKLGMERGLPMFSLKCYSHIGDKKGISKVVKKLIRSGEHDQAFGAIESGMADPADIPPSDLKELGHALLDSGKHDAAEKLFRICGDTNGLIKLARELAILDVERCFRLLEDNSGSENDYGFCGQRLHEAGKYGDAIIAYEKAGLDPSDKRMRKALEVHLDSLAGKVLDSNSKERITKLEEMIEVSMSYGVPLGEREAWIMELCDKRSDQGFWKVALDLAFFANKPGKIRQIIEDLRDKNLGRNWYWHMKEHEDYAKALLERDYATLAIMNAGRRFSGFALLFFKRLETPEKKAVAKEIVKIFAKDHIHPYRGGNWPMRVLGVCKEVGASSEILSLISAHLDPKELDMAIRLAKNSGLPEARDLVVEYLLKEEKLSSKNLDLLVSLARYGGSSSSLNAVAEALLEKDELYLALPLLKQVGNVRRIRQIAIDRLGAGDTAQAESYFRAIRDSMRKADLESLGKGFLRTGNLEKAKRYYSIAGRRIPKQLLLECGDRFKERGTVQDLWLARSYYLFAKSKSDRLPPDCRSRLIQLGDQFMAQSMVGSAIRCYEDGGEPDRKLDPSIYKDRANLSFGLELFRQEKASKAKFRALGSIALELGDVGTAARAYSLAGEELSVRLMEESAISYESKSWYLQALTIYIMAGDSKKAEQILDSGSIG